MFLFQFIFSPYHFSPPWSIYDFSIQPSHSSGTNLCPERVNSFCPTCTFTTRTRPSDPIIVLANRPSGQWPCGVSVHNTTTTSPTLKSFFSLFHFLREFKLAIHSFNHRCQKCLINSCTRHHLFFKLNWVSWSEPGANVPPSCPYRKWFGVNGTSSAGCDDWYVNGLLLIKISPPTKAVTSSLSFISAFPNMFLIIFLAALIIISLTPTKCGAAGRLNDHWTPLLVVVCLIFCWSNWFTMSFMVQHNQQRH